MESFMEEIIRVNAYRVDYYEKIILGWHHHSLRSIRRQRNRRESQDDQEVNFKLMT